ncbi:hypothetical protein McpSp1_14710 [Methanocorpusculaceae archaeon Sp1]|nr:hypothetical protein [Methanocorpusculaceae archaeon Sp1]
MRHGMLLLVFLLFACAMSASPVAAAAPADAVVLNGGIFTSAAAFAAALGEDNATVNGDTLTLKKDLNITGRVRIAGDMTIIGGGHTIWRGGSDFYLMDIMRGTLTLGGDSSKLTFDGQKDTYSNNHESLINIGSSNGLVMNDGVTLTNSITDNNVGGGITSSGTFTMNGGLISGNNAADAEGGGVCVYGGTFTMNGGDISGNTGYSGGGVCVYGGIFIMNDGEISANTAAYGGGVYVADLGSFTMNGGTISGNTARNNGDEVHLNDATSKFQISGNPTVGPNSTYLKTGTFINVTASLTGASPAVSKITPEKKDDGTIIVQLFADAVSEYENYFVLSPTLTDKALKYFDVSSQPELRIVTINSDNHTLTVIGGKGSGYYKENGNVTITADDVSEGRMFVNWTTSNGGTFADKNASSTDFTMPTNDVTVTANFADKPPHHVTITAPSNVYLNAVIQPTSKVYTDDNVEIPDVPLTWESDNNAILMFDSDTGEFTAVALGTANITANITANPDINASKTITVSKVPTPVPTPVPTDGGGSSDGGYSDSTSAGISPTGSVSFDSSVGFTGVNFPQGTAGNVVLNTKSFGVPAPQNSYLMVDISAPSIQGSAQIEFSVPMAMLADQGLSVSDVVLRHYVNGGWVNLPTFFIGEDRGAAKYVASTGSFSPFAIVYEKGGASIVQKSTPQPTTASAASATAAATTSATKTASDVSTYAATSAPTNPSDSAATAAPTLTQAPVPVAGALFGLLAACLVIRRKE